MMSCLAISGYGLELGTSLGQSSSSIIIAAQRFLGPLETSSAVSSEEVLRARDIALFGQAGKGGVDDTLVDVAEEV